ncbi:MAG: hypothetical protein RL033_7777 [Pseudomonadota bacterium]
MTAACNPDLADGVPSYPVMNAAAGASGVSPINTSPGSAGSNGLPNSLGPTGSNDVEQSQTNGGPLATGGSGGNNNTSGGGSGGSAGLATGTDTGSTAAAGTSGTTVTDPDPVVIEPLPPPGDAFFSDNFETGAPGTQPAGWTRWINYSTNANNALTEPQFALIDDQDSVSGNQSVHFHATGATQPAMLTRALPPGTNRLHLRVFIKTSTQLGSRTPDNPSNHETLIGLRATPNDGNFELRFGEAKGALGFNMVGPGRNDAVAPLPALWGSAPLMTPNAWHCVELEFSNEDPDNAEAHASVDGQLVRSVTGIADWHVPLGQEGTRWLNGMFNEVVLGWQSFSNPRRTTSGWTISSSAAPPSAATERR